MGIPNRHLEGNQTLDWKDHDMEAIRKRVDSYSDPTLCPEAAIRGEEVRLVLGREGLSAALKSDFDTTSDTDSDPELSDSSDTADLQVTDDLKNFIVDWAHSD